MLVVFLTILKSYTLEFVNKNYVYLNEWLPFALESKEIHFVKPYLIKKLDNFFESYNKNEKLAFGWKLIIYKSMIT